MRTKSLLMCTMTWTLLYPLARNYTLADGKKNHVATKACSPYTPRVGSAERKVILKTLHASYKRRFGLKKIAGKSVYYAVRHLKVCGNWAWIETDLTSGGKKLEHAPCAALLQRRNKQWVAIETWLLEEPGIDRAVMKTQYPEAPTKIFPAFPNS